MRKRVFSLLSIMLFLVSPAFAAHKAGTFTLSPMLGGIVFEGDQHVDDAFVYGVGIGYNLSKALTAEAAFFGSGGDADLFNYRLDALYHLLPDARLDPYVAAGIGGYEIDDDGEFMGNYGLGVLYQITDNIDLRADVRHLLVANESNLENNLLYTAGLRFAFGGAAKMVAAPAPAQPAPEPKIVEPEPAPVVPPTVPAQPIIEPPKDSDGDGVIDGNDQCPDTPKGTAVDSSGCPLDSDGDGVIDGNDRCPDTPKGVAVDSQGCELKLSLQINFDTNQAIIKPEFKPELAKAAAFIEENKAIPYVLVAGFTDSQGASAYNQKLSERRAEAVRRYLVEQYGVDPAKIRSIGYGESRPVADNVTAAGRYQNRRVEIVCCTILPPE